MMFRELRYTNHTPTPSRRLCSKLQDYTGTGNIYAYSPNSKQHAVRRIYNGLTNELYNLRWDNNGNLAQQTLYSVNNNAPTYLNMRMLFWDEDDRLNLVAGDGYLSYYAYGHDGNRAIKMTGNAAIDQTGTLLNSTNLENITFYPNEYLTVTQAEYTKYYYAGGNRIASKIGTGGFGKMQRLCTEDLNLSANASTLFGNALQQIVNITNQPNDEFPVNVCGGYSVATELLADPLPDFYISQTNLNFTQNNLLQQFRQNLAGGTEPVYYFHSDHLGSASWVTDGSGLPVQHLQYLPFGEHFVNEHSSNYDERFTFTGKERDAETGYYYHGARFNSSDIGWLSVDPMSDKYPSMTPYNYCAWNPIKLVDPEGCDTIKFLLDKGVIGSSEAEGNHCVQFYRSDEQLLSSIGDIPRGNNGKKGYRIIRERWEAKLYDSKLLIEGVLMTIIFDDNIIAEKIYNEIVDIGSDGKMVEWDYFSMTNGTGEILSAGVVDRMVYDVMKYTKSSVLSWHHFHPNKDLSYYPSESDQRFAKDLEGIPCYLHSQGRTTRFDEIVRHGIIPISLKKYSELYNKNIY